MWKVDGDYGSLGSGLCIPEMDALVASDLFLGWLDYENRMTSAVASRRSEARARLDAASNFVVVDGQLRFRQSFETIEDTETFSLAPTEVIDAARRLLTIDVAHGLSGIIHDTIVVEIGCSCAPFILWQRPPLFFLERHSLIDSCPAPFLVDCHQQQPHPVCLNERLAEILAFSFSSIGSTVIGEPTNQTPRHPTQNSSVRKPLPFLI